MMVLFSRRRLIAQIVATALMVSGANAFAGSHMEVVPDGASQPSVVQVERLEKLATYLDTKVDPKKFDMNTWGTTNNPDDPNYMGCAAGHATALFKSEGFTLMRTEHPTPGNPMAYVTCYNGNQVDAIARFFGVPGNGESSDYGYLFGGKNGKDINDPHAAAKRIREFTQRHRTRLTAETKSLCMLASW
jgi:hypothetical protein